jgi:hypothetical protein
MTPPDPPDAVPDFLLEQFDDRSVETLHGIVEYVRTDTYVPPDGMPDSMKEAFALQDEDTVAAAATYADDLAAFLEKREADSFAAFTGSASSEEAEWGKEKILE